MNQPSPVFSGILSQIKTLEILNKLILSVESSRELLYSDMAKFRDFFIHNVGESFSTALFGFVDSMNIRDPMILDKILNELVKNLRQISVVTLTIPFVPSSAFVDKAYAGFFAILNQPLVLNVVNQSSTDSFMFELSGLRYTDRFDNLVYKSINNLWNLHTQK